MKVYLDVCCFNRPFDDQGQARIRAESEAVERILAAADEGRVENVGSEMLRIEAARAKDSERRRRVRALLPTKLLALDDAIAHRARELIALGFRAADAVHTAAAEALGADALLTTDDRLERAGKRLEGRLRVRVANVLSFYREFKDAIDG
jgi:predicted nucleic acid-binding protein